jgi:YD repeat-containing protein
MATTPPAALPTRPATRPLRLEGRPPRRRPYATNGLNQYATTGQPNTNGSVAFTYDANGNLASEANWNGTAYIVSATYTYDVENRLVGRSGGVTLRYDPLGRLYEVAGNGNTTRFLYDGDALVAEYNTSGRCCAATPTGRAPTSR